MIPKLEVMGLGDVVKGSSRAFLSHDPLPPPYPLLLLVAEVQLPAVYLLLDWYWLSLDSVSLLR